MMDRIQEKERQMLPAERGAYFPAVLVVLLVLLLRDPAVLFAPAAPLEDGRELLEFYQNNRAPHTIFRDYAGYVSLGPNLVGYLVGFFQPWIGVHFLLWSAYLTTAAMLALPAASWVFYGLLTRWERLVIVAILALAPVGNFALVQMTMYSIWHLLFGLALVSVAGHVQGWGRCILVVILGAVALTSNPVCLLLLPVFVWRAWICSDLPGRLAFTTLVTIGLLYPFWGIIDGPSSSFATEGGDALWQEFIQAFSERVLAETLISTEIRMALRYRGLEQVFLLVGLVWLASLVWTWRMRESIQPVIYRRIFLLHGLAVVLMAATVFTRGSFLDSSWGHRYSYVSALLVILASTLTILATLSKKRQRFLSAFVAVLWLLAVNVFSEDLYRSSSDQGQAMRVGVTLLRFDEEECVIIDRGDWSVTLQASVAVVSCRVVR